MMTAPAQRLERTSSNDGTGLFARIWAVPGPLTTVVLCHGYCEHSGRYAKFATELNAAGVSLVAGDLRGHGLSEGARGFVSAFDDYVADFDALASLAGALTPDGTISVLGHSLGGLVVGQWLLSQRPYSPCGAILVSPLMGLRPPAGVLAALLQPLQKCLGGIRVPLPFASHHLTHDPSAIADHRGDPLVLRHGTLGALIEMRKSARSLLAECSRITTPMLVIYSGNDKVVDARATQVFCQKLGSRQTQCHEMTTSYHEVLNEVYGIRGRAIRITTDWLRSTTRLPS
jgi:alpha-beta hydrolase superfamily lysophospholipase